MKYGISTRRELPTPVVAAGEDPFLDALVAALMAPLPDDEMEPVDWDALAELVEYASRPA